MRTEWPAGAERPQSRPGRDTLVSGLPLTGRCFLMMCDSSVLFCAAQYAQVGQRNRRLSILGRGCPASWPSWPSGRSGRKVSVTRRVRGPSGGRTADGGGRCTAALASRQCPDERKGLPKAQVQVTHLYHLGHRISKPTSSPSKSSCLPESPNPPSSRSDPSSTCHLIKFTKKT